MVGKFDGTIKKEKNKALLEIKTCSAYMEGQWGLPETDEIPDYYLTQVHSYMMLGKFKEAHVALLSGGNSYKEYYIPADKDLQNIIFEKCLFFWTCVHKNDFEPLMTEDQKISLDDYKPEEIVKATNSIESRVKKIRIYKQDIKEKNTLVKEEEEIVKKYMKNEGILYNEKGDKKLATYKEQERNSFDTKAFGLKHPDLKEKFTKKTAYKVFRT